MCVCLYNCVAAPRRHHPPVRSPAAQGCRAAVVCRAARQRSAPPCGSGCRNQGWAGPRLLSLEGSLCCCSSRGGGWKHRCTRDGGTVNMLPPLNGNFPQCQSNSGCLCRGSAGEPSVGCWYFPDWLFHSQFILEGFLTNEPINVTLNIH